MLKRYVKPTAKGLGIELGGWHDFRVGLATELRRRGVLPKVISGVLGHARVNFTLDVYDKADVSDFAAPLKEVAERLLPTCYQEREAK